MRIVFFFALICSWMPFLYSAEEMFNFADFDSYQGKVTRDYVENKIKYYLEKDPSIQKYYQLTDESISIKNASGQIEYTLFFGELDLPKREKTQLSGARILLDPGHFGGRYAKLEERYVDISPWEPFDEGTLTFLTALKLKSLLEEKGAVVLMTRPGIGFGSIEIDFETYLELHPELIESGLPLNKIFRKYYNQEDLKSRAEKINAFHPDLALIIHYNASSSEISPVDYSLAFVPGAFMKGELDQREARYAFLRLIVTDTIEESIRLSQCVLKELQREIHLPLMQTTGKNSTLKVCSGVYCRNLALTRRVKAPLCYLEALMQNYPDELDHLSTKDAIIDGVPCSSRLEQVAVACYYAIEDYFSDSLAE